MSDSTQRLAEEARAALEKSLARRREYLKAERAFLTRVLDNTANSTDKTLTDAVAADLVKRIRAQR